MAGHDVQHAGLRQGTVRPAGGVAEEIDDVGVCGLQRVRSTDADEYPQSSASGECVAVGHQRPRERKGLGGRLAPPERIAGTQQILHAGRDSGALCRWHQRCTCTLASCTGRIDSLGADTFTAAGSHQEVPAPSHVQRLVPCARIAVATKPCVIP